MTTSAMTTILLAFSAITLIAAQDMTQSMLLEGEITNDYVHPLPIEYIDPLDLPDSFTWGNVNGQSYLTRMLNQHIPQYCGSCWAHAAMSSLADRIKIARSYSPGWCSGGTDINLSIQFILNCGGGKHGLDHAGSCHGGSALRAFKFIKKNGFIPYDTCQTYIACSSDSTEGFCSQADTTCSPKNICRTCSHKGCFGITHFPNATVDEYGTYSSDVDATMAEIFARGPVHASVNATPILDYQGGIISDPSLSSIGHSHAVSIVGWGYDKSTKTKHWIVRNSWGQYWGEMGFFRVEMGKNLLSIEDHISWATPGQFSNEYTGACQHEAGMSSTEGTVYYMDPSNDMASVKRRLEIR
mmetsp:Transcript_25645/g.37751  ORF Transcript_25645/g.37751 Transcript_25645/m.37751 type:complete len:355 (-) Transcript_25645:384-1448(-)|eukprot:CAMPEP_0195512832 /NCGR_PEP_ID=MMETSP0794_2-20130614/4650_1 /TAXON_ID=515487 /ORGANISM="Stephanopyxis turris, Strain CCMP 815" /LENGTH=354 /DNA_ID=CAMNT_0040640701 /DNA_START=88 /DNA_END=1152 /DNA_ORIENTATION=-